MAVNSLFFQFVNSPLGYLTLIADDENLKALLFGKHGEYQKYDMIFSTNPIIEKAKRQLIEYFKGTRRNFALPVKPEGTEFQQKVWQLLMDIPYGETLTYQELAERTGNSKASRAVGIANSKNPISIIIPCHRVVRKNGESGGYAGGVTNKEYLLRLESR